MFEAQKGGSQNAGPAVGKGGNCDGFLEEVKSQVMEQGGVKMVVRGARGAVMVAAILRGCKPSTTSGVPHTNPHESTTSTADHTGWRIYDGWSFFFRLRPPKIDGSGRTGPGRGPSGHLIDWAEYQLGIQGAIGIVVDLSLFRSRRSLSIPVPSPPHDGVAATSSDKLSAWC